MVFQRGLKKKSNEEEDPVNGLKFDEPDLSSKDQSDALHFRGKFYSKLVIANSSETRAKSTISIAFWIDEVVKSHVPQSKGKHFINMGHSGKTEEGLCERMSTNGMNDLMERKNERLNG